MRDDFKAATKDLLARRVGFKCSNPGCRQPTSVPQADPVGSVNIGVAAHITAASADGPRYDPALTSEQRVSADNGIWLCQTDGKLVDNDKSRYTVECLKTWKSQAEAAAARELEQRLRRFPDRSAVFERMERLMPALLSEMRQDLAAHPLRREFVIMKRSWSYWAKGNELFYFCDDHLDLDDKLRILENEGLVRDITYNNARRYVLTEELADYLGAP
jgi:hypothetical protein